MTVSRLPIALQQAVMHCLRQKLTQANQALECNYPEPKVTYNQKGTVAGSAHIKSWEIKLNAVLLQENSQAFIDEVVPHELAHLLAARKFGKVAPHGKEWKYVMEHIFNIKASRTHSFDIRSVQGQTHSYQCECQLHQLTVRRHKRLQSGSAEYFCKHCKSRLLYKPEAHCS